MPLLTLPAIRRWLSPRLLGLALVALLAAVSSLATLSAEDATWQPPSEPALWHLLDFEQDGVPGTGTARAWAELSLTAPDQPIIVAVIDSGCDVAHPELLDALWLNPVEANGVAGQDDDGNGFIDDTLGWNFIGHADGTNLVDGRMEETRLVALMAQPDFAWPDSAEARAELERAQRMHQEGVAGYQAQFMQVYRPHAMLRMALADLATYGVDVSSVAAATAAVSDEPLVLALQQVVGYLGPYQAQIDQQMDQARSALASRYNPAYDESAITGDDPTELDQVGYGNSQVSVPARDFHGTHVAGIIAASPDGRGAVGHCPWVQLMTVRTVPNGDERDKDVANAIRYAVDNGAHIINMSFGKSFSPDKAYVDAAVRYALEHDVLLVHGAGNEGRRSSALDNFPNPYLLDESGQLGGTPIANWLEVGASTRSMGADLPAQFSNYGSMVDLFAPGEDILSTAPGGGVESASGTSMAAPNAAGVAALVLSQYPDLGAVELKALLIDSARRLADLQVNRPGDGMTVPFSSLSTSAGLIDAYAALQLAAERHAAGADGADGAAADTPAPAQPATESPND